MNPPTMLAAAPLVDLLPAIGRTPSLSRLVDLYRHPAPYASIYLAADGASAHAPQPLSERWQRHRLDLLTQGATPEMLEAADRLLRRKRPPSASGICLQVAGDGAGLVDHDHLPPLDDGVKLGSLPAVSQLLEWGQRRIPTLLVAASGHDRASVVNFSPSGVNHQYMLDHGPGRTISLLSKLVVGVEAQLVIVAGQGSLATALANGLPQRLPVDVRVVAEPEAETTDQLAAAVLRQIGIGAAALTLRYLREQRFLATVGGATEGSTPTIAALVAGEAESLLVHDEVDDDRTVWIGSMPRQLSPERSDLCGVEVRLIDGLIRSAVIQSLDIRITPSLGPAGPTGHVAALTIANHAGALRF
jgi:hypothetical protein